MKVFIWIVIVKHIYTGRINVSSQGYSNIDDARAFILDRADKPQASSKYGSIYSSIENHYIIKPITVKEI